MQFPTEETNIPAKELIDQGYRKVSNRHRLVARIDREDWVIQLAIKLRRAPADLYVPGEPHPSGSWCDFYRRVHSEDVLMVSAETIKEIPSSGFDPVGYVPK